MVYAIILIVLLVVLATATVTMLSHLSSLKQYGHRDEAKGAHLAGQFFGIFNGAVVLIGMPSLLLNLSEDGVSLILWNVIVSILLFMTILPTTLWFRAYRSITVVYKKQPVYWGSHS